MRDIFTMLFGALVLCLIVFAFTKSADGDDFGHKVVFFIGVFLTVLAFMLSPWEFIF